jgi:hypothetical protein
MSICIPTWRASYCKLPARPEQQPEQPPCGITLGGCLSLPVQADNVTAQLRRRFARLGLPDVRKQLRDVDYRECSEARNAQRE